MSPTSPSDLRVRLLRNHAVLAFLQVTGTALALFLILRVFGPWLVDKHDTTLLIVAVALFLACPLLVVQLVYALWTGRRRLRARLAVLDDAAAPHGYLN